MTRKTLTVKQDAFVKEYILNGGNATQAAKKARYKGNDHQLQVIGNQNLSKLVISKSIKAHRKKKDKKFSLSFEQKQKMLASNFKLAQKLGQISAANGAINELNKMDGDHSTEKFDHTSSDGSMTPTVIERVIIDNKQDAKDFEQS